MAPQLSQAGASDWKSANCSLRAVLGPASLGMMPARASSAALMSPWPLPFAWPLPLPLAWPLVWPLVLGGSGLGGWGLGWRFRRLRASAFRLAASGRLFRDRRSRLYGLVLTSDL